MTVQEHRPVNPDYHLTRRERGALRTLAAAYPREHLATHDIPLRESDSLIRKGLVKRDGLYGHYVALTHAGFELARKEGMLP